MPQDNEKAKEDKGKVVSIVQDTWAVPTLPEFLKEVAASPKWLIPDLLQEGSLTLLSGQKKRAMKTFLAFHVSLCLAGKVKAGLIAPERKGAVLIIEEEGTKAGTMERLLGLCKGLGIAPEKFTNLYFAHHHGIMLDDPKWKKKILAFIKEKKIALVILDALVYMHKRDENNIADIAPVIQTLRDLRRAGPSIIYLMHTGKGVGLDKKADPDDQVRGSGIFTDLYDTHWALRRYSRHETEIRFACFHKDMVEDAYYNVKWAFGKNAEGTTCAIEKISEYKKEKSVSVKDKKEIA